MRFQVRNNHIIDLIFPIALLFVFATSSLVVLVLAANIYGSTTDQIQTNDQNRTSLSYVSQKIRQNDVGGDISIEEVDDIDCLTIKSSQNGSRYVTYIYAYDGMLKELFVNGDADVPLKSGKDILAIESLSMEETADGLFSFLSTDKKGQTDALMISERSTP